MRFRELRRVEGDAVRAADVVAECVSGECESTGRARGQAAEREPEDRERGEREAVNERLRRVNSEVTARSRRTMPRASLRASICHGWRKGV